MQYYLHRGFTDILTFTPCDLWPLLKGRTLFFSGDSQTQVCAAFECPFVISYLDCPKDGDSKGVGSHKRCSVSVASMGKAAAKIPSKILPLRSYN